MNRPFYTSASNPSSTRQPLSQAPPLPLPTKPLIHDRFHSRNTSDPQDYHRRLPIQPPPLQQHRYEKDDGDEKTEDAEEDEEIEMTAYSTRPAASNGSGSSRPGSSHKDSGSGPKK